jgi:hypothetical protein
VERELFKKIVERAAPAKSRYFFGWITHEIAPSVNSIRTDFDHCMFEADAIVHPTTAFTDTWLHGEQLCEEVFRLSRRISIDGFVTVLLQTRRSNSEQPR